MPSDQVMHEWKQGRLHSGSKRGKKVRSHRQAVAIMLSERRKEQGKGRRRRGAERR